MTTWFRPAVSEKRANGLLVGIERVDEHSDDDGHLRGLDLGRRVRVEIDGPVVGDDVELLLLDEDGLG